MKNNQPTIIISGYFISLQIFFCIISIQKCQRSEKWCELYDIFVFLNLIIKLNSSNIWNNGSIQRLNNIFGVVLGTWQSCALIELEHIYRTNKRKVKFSLYTGYSRYTSSTLNCHLLGESDLRQVMMIAKFSYVLLTFYIYIYIYIYIRTLTIIIWTGEHSAYALGSYKEWWTCKCYKERVGWLVGWFLCLMAYQVFLGYLMPKAFSEKDSSGTI